MADHDYSGVWRSSYTYHSDSRDGDFENEHYVRFHQKGNQLTVETLPEVNNSYLILRLSVNDNVVTGTWEETTQQDGPYKGVIYSGGIQLVIAADNNSMEGKWVGFGKDMSVNTGPWSFTFIGAELPDSITSAKPEQTVQSS